VAPADRPPDRYILYAGVQLLMPGDDAGIDLGREYGIARGMEEGAKDALSRGECSAVRYHRMEIHDGSQRDEDHRLVASQDSSRIRVSMKWLMNLESERCGSGHTTRKCCHGINETDN